MDVLRRLAMIGALAAAAIILMGTLTPLLSNDGESCLLGIPCTVGHALAFGAFGVSLAGLYVSSRWARRAPVRALVMLVLAIWIFAATTELLQAQIGRDPSLGDWAADMAGAVGGLLAGGFAIRLLWGSRLLPQLAPGARTARRGRPSS
ncbi:MAG: VanZ family protein [Dehalococcoidia bacterium]